MDDAILATNSLRDQGVEAELLHARFAICDRLEREKALQAYFGRSGQDRAGKVLVATQVVEQSLDLDFDVMVSDLAPIGSLIQRAGRLWRHMDIRPCHIRPVPGPILHVLSPDPDHVSCRSWVHKVLRKGAWVYPQAELWRSARVLFDEGEICAPDRLRHLIEAVHGMLAPPVPEALEDAQFQQEGKDILDKQLARNCLLNPFLPFNQVKMFKIWDDEQFPTRLGVPQVTLALAVDRDGTLHPYSDEGWAMSEVQVSRVKFGDPQDFDQSDPRIQSIKVDWPKGRQEHVLIAPLGHEGQIREGLIYDKDRGAIWE